MTEDERRESRPQGDSGNGTPKDSSLPNLLGRIAEAGSSIPRILLPEAHSAGVHPKQAPSSEGPGRVGQYRVTGEIARGGVGIVYRAQDAFLGRDVAIKVLREEHADNREVLRRFVEEAQIEGQLQHPGIAPVYEIGVDEADRPYFAMKLIKGDTLAGLLADRSDPESGHRRFLGVFEKVCQAVGYAHARGVVHRDLKPSNILVGQYGDVQVVDWGLAKVLSRGGVADERRANRAAREDASAIHTIRTETIGAESLTGSVMGTPRYMPPEQAMGDVTRVDERSDVFSLGAVLLEILTGRPPYVGEDSEILGLAARAQLAGALERLDSANVEAELQEIVRACLSPAPEARPRSAGVLAEEIGEFLARAEDRAREAALKAAEDRAKVAEEQARVESEEAEVQTARAEAEREHALAAEETEQVETQRAAEQRAHRLVQAEALRAQGQRRARLMTLAVMLSGVLALTLAGGAWLWLHGRGEARRAEIARKVESALTEATLLAGQAGAAKDPALWERALSAGRNAEALARESEASEEVRDRATGILAGMEAAAALDREAAERRDRETVMIERLRAIREGHFLHQSASRTAEEYEAAFREFGIDAANLSPAEAAGKIGESGIPLDLAFGLDGWSREERDRVLSARLRQTAMLADPDPWRRRLREAKDRADLLRLADSPEVDEAPAVSLFILAQALSKEDELPERLDLAILDHPDDYALKSVVLRRMSRSEDRSVGLRACTQVLALGEAAWQWRELGYLLSAIGRNEEALQAMEQALVVDPGDQNHTILPYVQLQIALGRADEGLKVAWDMPAVGHCAMRVLTARVNALLALSRLDDAAGVGAEMEKAFPDQAMTWTTIGRVRSARSDGPGAIEAFEIAGAQNQAWDARGALDTLAVVSMSKGELGRAEELARRALELVPDSTEALSRLAEVLSRQGKHAEARKLVMRALETDLLNAPVHRRSAAASWLSEGDYELAADSLREAVALAPGDPAAWSLLATARKQLGDDMGSVSAWRKAVDLRPMSAQLRGSLVSGLLDLDRPEKAHDEARTLTTYHGDQAASHAIYSYVLWTLGEFDAALDAAHDAMEVDNTDRSARGALARALLGAGQAEKAEDLFRSLLQESTGDLAARVGLAAALTARDRADDAIRVATEAVAIAPTAPDVRIELGRARRAAGDLEGAISAYREALSASRTRWDTRKSCECLAAALYEADRPFEALAVARFGLTRSQHAPGLRNLEARGYLLSGEFEPDRAAEIANDLLLEWPDDPAASYTLAAARAGGVSAGEAIPIWEEYIGSEESDSGAVFDLAVALRDAGRLADAISRTRKAGRSRGYDGETRRALTREMEILAGLEPEWEGILSGNRKPANAGEALSFAELLRLKGHPVEALEYFRRAFAMDRALMDVEVPESWTVRAAAAAVAALGSGSGSEVDRVEYARLALRWLRHDLARSRIDERVGDMEEISRRVLRMKRTRSSRLLSGIRDEGGIASLPEAVVTMAKFYWDDLDRAIDTGSSRLSPGVVHDGR